MSRTDLLVPFEQKDEAKRLGARWDATRKVWYVPAGKDVSPFRRWLPREYDPDDITVRSDWYFIVRSTRDCWKCGARTAVYGFLLPAGHETMMPTGYDEETDEEQYEMVGQDAPSLVSNVTVLLPSVADRMKSLTATSYRPDCSQMAQSHYWMNHCEQCDAKQGDFELFDEPGGAFFPVVEQDALHIDLLKISERFECEGSTGYGTPAELLWSRGSGSTGSEPRSLKRSLLLILPQ